MEQTKRNCELCDELASIYCPSDNAFLCFSCDTKVHCANFLVARHVRSFLCPNCSKLHGDNFSGAGPPPPCRNCTPSAAAAAEDSLSSSSSCVSSTGEEVAETTSFRPRREKLKVVPDLKVEGILVNWCRRININNGGAVINTAVELVSGCLGRITTLPFRVSLAACFWVAVKVVCRRGGTRGGVGYTCQDLRRLEQISGVPAKLILATEVKITRVIKGRQPRDDCEEGWAEC